MGREIDMQRVGLVCDAAIFQKVIEARNALELLQAADHCITAIVADDDNHLVARKDRRIDIRVHHHIGAVAQHHDGRATDATGAGLGHRTAPPSGDFIAHAGETEFKVKSVRRLDAPAFGHLARNAACRRDKGVAWIGLLVHHVHNLRVGRDRCIGRGLMRVEQRIPFGKQRLGMRQVGGRRRPVSQPCIHFTHGFQRVAHHRQRPMLDRVEPRRVDRDETGVLRKRRP